MADDTNTLSNGTKYTKDDMSGRHKRDAADLQPVCKPARVRGASSAAGVAGEMQQQQLLSCQSAGINLGKKGVKIGGETGWDQKGPVA